MLCTCLVPENVGTATDDDYRAFGERAANDMFQKPAQGFIDMFIKYSCRKTADEPLTQPPEQPPADPHRPYMSVWEWCHRAWWAKLQPDTQPTTVETVLD